MFKDKIHSSNKRILQTKNACQANIIPLSPTGILQIGHDEFFFRDGTMQELHIPNPYQTINFPYQTIFFCQEG